MRTPPVVETPVPAGVTVEVLPAPPVVAPEEKPEPQPAPDQEPAPPAEEEVQPIMYDLDYEGESYETVLYDMSEQLNVMILCMDAKVLNRKIKLHASVPEKDAIQFVAAMQMLRARPAMILCTEEEIMEGELCPKVRGDKHIKVKFEEANLYDALDYISKLTDTRLLTSPDMAEQIVSFEAADISLTDLMAKLAEQLECANITGYLLEAFDPEAGLKQLEKLSDEELNNMFSKGLDAMDKGMADRGMNNQQGMRAGVGRGLDGFMSTYESMDPQERQELVNKGTNMIERFGGIMNRLSPNVQGRLKQRIGPIAGIVAQGFMSLGGEKRRELQPLFDAFSKMGW